MFANILLGRAQDVESVEADGPQDDPIVSTVQKEILKNNYFWKKIYSELKVSSCIHSIYRFLR